MRKILILAGAALFIHGCSHVAPQAADESVAPVASKAPAAAPEVLNLADDFVAFWDATKGLPTPERVAIFKRDVASLIPGFYEIDRFEGRVTQERQDERIARSIENFDAIREAYIVKAEAFDSDLDRNLATFREAFPDFKFDIGVVLLHSLGEMDGGTRELNGKQTLVFGADMMATVHHWDDEAAFFDHELFHVHHSAFFGECDAVWCGLWKEGLAVYVASTLNPEAGNPELLLEFPKGLVPDTQARLKEALLDLRGSLDSTEIPDLMRLFSTDEDPTGLPGRRGYYLGLLVAREIGKGRDLASLARMTQDEARPLIVAAIDKLIASAPAAENQ
jgi:hypothetical protein